jgi:hypothetical protein
MNQINVASAGLLLLASLFAGTSSALAQMEGSLEGSGVNAGKGSTVVPTNCVESRDGSISCHTKITYTASSSSARPYYTPFND